MKGGDGIAAVSGSRPPPTAAAPTAACGVPTFVCSIAPAEPPQRNSDSAAAMETPRHSSSKCRMVNRSWSAMSWRSWACPAQVRSRSSPTVLCWRVRVPTTRASTARSASSSTAFRRKRQRRRVTIVWLPQLRQNSAFRTNIGLLNSGDIEARVRVFLYDASGNELVSRWRTLEPSAWMQLQEPFARLAGRSDIDSGYARSRGCIGSRSHRLRIGDRQRHQRWHGHRHEEVERNAPEEKGRKEARDGYGGTCTHIAILRHRRTTVGRRSDHSADSPDPPCRPDRCRSAVKIRQKL